MDKTLQKKQVVNVILPNRIGDAILCLPALICLKQLIQKYNPDDFKIIAFVLRDLKDVFESLEICKFNNLNFLSKIISWFYPADIAFFLSTTSESMGFRSKKSFGEIMKHKKYANYSVNMPYLAFDRMKDYFPEELNTYLTRYFNLSRCSVRFFGICLELGYSVDQIKSTFNFSSDVLNDKKEFTDWKFQRFVQTDYIVFCMEAASGRKTSADRRWREDYYFEISKYAYEKYNLNSVFIGIDKKISIPENSYMIDLRRQINIAQATKLLKYSKCYVGNDTGPLHLANLMKKPSISVYSRPHCLFDFKPNFSYLNNQLLNPQTFEEILPLLDKIIEENN